MYLRDAMLAEGASAVTAVEFYYGVRWSAASARAGDEGALSRRYRGDPLATDFRPERAEQARARRRLERLPAFCFRWQ